jgi:putative transposase
MKHLYPKISLGKLCRLFGKSRHGHYDHLWRQRDDGIKDDIILQHVHKIRETLPQVGTRKLHYMLDPLLATHCIEVGRDYLFDLLEENKLLIRNRRRKVITTDSHHWMHKYPNLIQELDINRPEQVWVSDITYIRLVNQWGYLSLITDAYSHKIMGYCFRLDMSAQGCVEALQMALDNRAYRYEKLIHHSDRGSQYCSSSYVNVLKYAYVGISMTEKGDPYENALAERVNGIIKAEFNLYSSQLGFEETKRLVEQSIKAYNEVRPHSSCDYLTPDQAHLQKKILRKRWKNYSKHVNKISETEIDHKEINDDNSFFEANNQVVIFDKIDV